MNNYKNSESLWREDLVEILKDKLSSFRNYKDYKIESGIKILKDVYIHKNSNKKLEFQLGFFEQDIVLYKDKLDLGENIISHNIKFHNSKDKSKVIVPKSIIELKYMGVNSHSLIVYSEIFREIKGIFPETKFYLLLRYNEKSQSLLMRHCKNFDKIISFGEIPKIKKPYIKNQFLKELKKDKELRRKFKSLLECLKNDLVENQ